MKMMEVQMPRPANMSPSGQAKAVRQANYRIKLRQRGEPEADRVDTALSSAVAAFVAMVDDKKLEELKTPLKMLLRGTLDLLVDAGFDREASAKVLRRRVSLLSRPEIANFIEAGRFERRLTKCY